MQLKSEFGSWAVLNWAQRRGSSERSVEKRLSTGNVMHGCSLSMKRTPSRWTPLSLMSALKRHGRSTFKSGQSEFPEADILFWGDEVRSQNLVIDCEPARHLASFPTGWG